MIEPLLDELLSVGLATEERTGPDDENPELACHELLRERVRNWMTERPGDRGEWTENSIRLAYAERLAAVFDALQHQNMTLALAAGSRAVVYCVQAEAWDKLGEFASRVVTGSNDPQLLEGLIPHLGTAAESAPEGRPRWRPCGSTSCRGTWPPRCRRSRRGWHRWRRGGNGTARASPSLRRQTPSSSCGRISVRSTSHKTPIAHETTGNLRCDDSMPSWMSSVACSVLRRTSVPHGSTVPPY